VKSSSRISSTGEPHAFWRLKRLRELKGLTLEQLADGTGLTKSYLSKVERGISVPSIATALKLAQAFDVPVGELFGVNAGRDDFVVVRKGERKPFHGRRGESTGYRYEAIAPGATHGLFETFVMQPPFTLAAARSSFEHGGQEMIFVIKGRIEISLPQHKVVLQPGDCIIFDARLPHRSISVGKQHAEALVIVTHDNARNVPSSSLGGSTNAKRRHLARSDRSHDSI
jgi:transcriptional regulator with XRE-family HTH domain